MRLNSQSSFSVGSGSISTVIRHTPSGVGTLGYGLQGTVGTVC